jgi:hypothetical protein
MTAVGLTCRQQKGRGRERFQPVRLQTKNIHPPNHTHTHIHTHKDYEKTFLYSLWGYEWDQKTRRTYKEMPIRRGTTMETLSQMDNTEVYDNMIQDEAQLLIY